MINKELVTKINAQFDLARSSRQKWYSRSYEYKVVLENDVDGTGTQFTAEQLQQIRQRYGIPLSINILRPLVEQLMSFLTSAKASITVIPIGDSTKEIAYVHREVIKGILYTNNYLLEQELAIKDAIVSGHGVIGIEVDNYLDRNRFRVLVRSIPYSFVYIDPNAKRPDYQDAEYMVIAQQMTASKAKKAYGLTDEQMKEVFESVSNYTPDDYIQVPAGNYEDTRVVWIQQYYSKEVTNVEVPISIPGAETQGTETPDTAQLPQMIREKQIKIRRIFKVGNSIISDVYLDIENYPLFFYTFSFNRSPFPYSMIGDVIDIQHTINKSLAITLENAQLLGSGKWLAPEGAITDKEDFAKQSATPGGLITYVATPDLPDGGRPIPVPGQPLNNAWYSLFQGLIKMMEYITGIFDLVQGDSQNAPVTAEATTSLQNFGTQRPKMYARHFDYTNQLLTETLIQFYQRYSPLENVITYLTDTEAYVTIKTNVQAAMNQQVQQIMQQNNMQVQMPPEQLATIIENETLKQIKLILGDVRNGRYKVRYQTVTDLPTTRQMVMGFLQSLLQRTSNDAYGMAIVRMLLKLADYPEIDRLTQEVDVIQQLQQQVMQLQQQLQQLATENQQLKQENLQAKEDVIIEGLKADAEIFSNKMKTDVELAKQISKEVEKIEKEKRNLELQKIKAGNNGSTTTSNTGSTSSESNTNTSG